MIKKNAKLIGAINRSKERKQGTGTMTMRKEQKLGTGQSNRSKEYEQGTAARNGTGARYQNKEQNDRSNMSTKLE